MQMALEDSIPHEGLHFCISGNRTVPLVVIITIYIVGEFELPVQRILET